MNSIKTITINKEKMKEAVDNWLAENGDKGGLSKMSKIMGHSAGFLSNATASGELAVPTLHHLKALGVDTDAFTEEAKEEPKKAEDSGSLPEMIRAAVYNGTIDATLMLLKDDTVAGILKSAIMALFNDEDFRKEMQFIIFTAINGARVKAEQEKSGKELQPQRWTR